MAVKISWEYLRRGKKSHRTKVFQFFIVLYVLYASCRNNCLFVIASLYYSASGIYNNCHRFLHLSEESTTEIFSTAFNFHQFASCGCFYLFISLFSFISNIS